MADNRGTPVKDGGDREEVGLDIPDEDSLPSYLALGPTLGSPHDVFGPDRPVPLAAAVCG